MRLAALSLRHPIATLLLFGLACLAGISAFHVLTVKNMPDFEQPQFTLALSLPGASAAQLEVEVAKPVEDAIAQLPKVHYLASKIVEGEVLIRVEFDQSRPSERCLFELKDTIDRIRGNLPVDLEPARIRHLTLAAGSPTLLYAVQSNSLSESDLTTFVEDTVARAVSDLPGAAHFEVIGGVEREVSVALDPVRVNALGVTAVGVTRAIKNLASPAAGGRTHLGATDQGIRAQIGVHTVQDVENLLITLPGGGEVRLAELATVADTEAEITSAARLDGAPAVGFQVLHETGADELALIAQVRTLTRALEQAHPGVHFQEVASMQEEIQEEYSQSMHMLYEGALLTIVVIWLFLRSWRATLIGALALPLSVLPTFAILYVAGFTLNTITLLALTVVTGILVDDAIVEVENVVRHQQDGRPLRQVIEQAVREIARAVTATTAVLVAVFLPMSYMRGFSGLVFQQFGWAASAAVICSLAVARAITPLLALWLLERTPAREKPEGRLLRHYLISVDFSLRHPLRLLGLTALLFAGSMWEYGRLSSDFIPEADHSATTLTLEAAPGTRLPETLELTEAIRHALTDPHHPVEGIQHVFTRVGELRLARNGGAGAPSEVRTAELKILLAPAGHRPSEAAVEAAIRERLADFPGVRIAVNGAGFGSKLTLTLASSDIEALGRAAGRVQQELARVPGLAGVSSANGLTRAELNVRIAADRAAALGVNPQDIAETVRLATVGDFPANLPKLNLGARELPIRVLLRSADVANLDALRALTVSARAGVVPLSAIADLELIDSPVRIERYDRERYVKITADLSGRATGDVLKDIAALPSIKALPTSVRWVHTDEAELIDELFANFGVALVWAGIAIYAILVLLFADFIQPLTILMAVPFSVVGAVPALALTHTEVSLPVCLGAMLLLGLAMKNSILLVDAALQAEREHGLGPWEAVREACRLRVRPIWMTTLAMIAGMLPILLGWGSGDLTFSRPMAIAVVGGLISSTALSVLIVPILYVLAAAVRAKLRLRPAPDLGK